MHYVMTDLHGEYDAYLKMLENIRFSKEDKMYILGDVIDRGREPIRLLKHMMNQQNIVFLIGNHEDMMIQALKKKGSSLQDLVTTTEMKRWNRNGGMATLERFIQLNEEEQGEIIRFLENSLVAIPQIKINGRIFYLVHACPGEQFYSDEVKYKDASREEIHQMVWDRRCLEEWTLPESYAMYNESTILLFGHTKTNGWTETYPSEIRFFPKQNAFDVDCYGQLGCICMETLERYYVNIE